MTVLLFCARFAFADDPVPAPPTVPEAPPAAPAPAAAPVPAPVTPVQAPPPGKPGYIAPVPHPSVDPLMPQSYRTIPRGDYVCKVRILVTEKGAVQDVENVQCDQDAYYALATAIVQWTFDPATQDGRPVASALDYENTFSVVSYLPRKHIVGFVGAAAHVGGAGWFGAEARIHLGEQISLTGGVDVDQDYIPGVGEPIWVPAFRADFAISSRRRHFEHRGIFGFAIGGFGDIYGSAGMNAALRGEVMTPIPGLSIGGDAGVALLFSNPTTVADVGFWQQEGAIPFYPWLRASVIWYAPLPKDRFVVVPREQDPTVYEPIIPEPEPLPDTGKAFAGVWSVHWSEIEASQGGNTEVGAEFDLYPPGVYRCDVRALVGNDGIARVTRAEICPTAARAAAEANVKSWEWPEDQAYEVLKKYGKAPPVREDALVQAMFPAPLFIRRDDAEPVPTESVKLLEAGEAKALPRGVKTPTVWVKGFIPPEWGSTRPTGACAVEVDLDDTGKVLKSRWASGEIEISGQVNDALEQWTFYPVIVKGERVAARVRLSMCGY